MKRISLASAITLTEWSERTIYRKFADGSLVRHSDNGRTTLDFAAIQAHLCVPLEQDDWPILEQANAGYAQAQCELALIFLSHHKPKGAVVWLELSARQGDADAMHWLARCYLAGDGVALNDHLGIMWLARAAALGHVISQEQLKVLHPK